MRSSARNAALATVLGLAAVSAAGTWDVDLNAALFGYLNQNTIPGWGNIACGPTAAVNSLAYLENRYPDVYGRSLIPDTNLNGVQDGDELRAVAQNFGSAALMNTIANGTTFHDDFIWGKQTYIEQRVPGKTVYQAQDYWTWNNHTQPTWVQSAAPSWQFLYNQLKAGKDVETLLSWPNDGHYLTLTGFHWNDADNDLVLDSAENARINFVNPATGAGGTAKVWQNASGGQIQTDYTTTGSWISTAVSEGKPFVQPVAYYPLNGNANDESGNGRNGIVHGATKCQDRHGVADSAYSFDGSDDIEVTNPPSVETYATFMAWVYVDSDGHGGYIIDKGTYNVLGSYSITIYKPGTELQLQVRACVGGTDYWATSDQVLPKETWTHVAGVYDGTGTGLTLYVNGEFAANTPISGSLYENASPLVFGGDVGNPASFFHGRVDDVRIYDVALSQTEIRQLVPEPATLSLLALGGLALLRRKSGYGG